MQGYKVTPSGEFWEVRLAEGQSIDPLVDLVRARGLNLRHLVEKRQTLEDLFVATVVAAEPGVDYVARADGRAQINKDRP
ncbi:MAG: hypothetical protein E6K70_12110 [Planctomycetota bacterium]|nr:MAG: hypothetical protein E6K70_12110 [Planctomycetota bacterium]